MADDFFKKTGKFLKKGGQYVSDKFNLKITDLIDAVKKNDVEMVARCMNVEMDPNQQDGINRRALPMAIDNLNAQIVKLLLLGGANPNLPGKDGESAIFKAASWDDENLVRMLMAAGGDINHKNKNGVSALEEAQRKGLGNMVNVLQGFKAEQKAVRIEKDTAKHEAIKAKAGAAKERREQEAEKEKERQVAEAQKEQKDKEDVMYTKYDVENEGLGSGLLQAILHEDEEASLLFAQRVEDPNIIYAEQKTTALMAAIAHKNTKVVQTLIEKGADTSMVIAGGTHSPLTMAVSMNAHKLVKYILDKNNKEDAEVLNAPDQLLSPAFLAYKDAKMIDYLLSAGADPYFGGKEGRSPVVKAIEKASVAILPVLAKNKIDLTKETEGKTPIEWAIHFDRKDWVIGLLEEGVTASPEHLELANSMGREDIVGVLEEE